MVYVGSVRTFTRSATPIIEEPVRRRPVVMPVINLPKRRTRVPANAMMQQHKLFNLTLAPRYDDTDYDNGFDAAPNITRMPVREQGIESDVKVPLYQSLISGGFTALSSGLIIGLTDSIVTTVTGWPWLSDIQWFHHAAIGGIIGILSASGQWRKLLSMNRALLWAIESMIGEDIDGDGEVGDPGLSVYIETKGEANNETVITPTQWPLGVSKTLAVIARLHQLDGYWSRNRYTGKDKGIISQGEFGKINEYLNKYQLVDNNELTDRGWDFFQKLLSETEGDE